MSEAELKRVVELGIRLEQAFEWPQDIEWTIREGNLYLLQARPITVTEANDTPLWQLDDKRAWYRSLHVSYDRLMELKQQIQDRYFPELERTATALSATDLNVMDETTLEEEVLRRKQLVEDWEHTYWDMFIPFAHGVRLFGEVYNRVMQPESPFEFIELLTHEKMESLQRNRELARLGKHLQSFAHADSAEQLPAEIQNELGRFMENYGKSSFFDTLLFKDVDQVLQLARRFAALGNEPKTSSTQKRRRLEAAFLETMTFLGREDGAELLELARISYRLRDDDNLQVSRIEAEYLQARDELSRRRSGQGATTDQEPLNSPATHHEDEPRFSQGIAAEASIKAYGELEDKGIRIKPRQITGSSASVGIATGRVRVIETADDLFAIQPGEVLTVDGFLGIVTVLSS